MSTKKARIDTFAADISDLLSDYSGDVTAVVKEEVEKAGADLVKEIKARAPHRSGKYAESWKIQKKTSGPFGASVIVGANKPFYRLTHLLEHGHAKVLWGHETGGEVAPKPHIGPAEAVVTRDFQESLERRISET